MKPSRATLNTHRSTEGAQNKEEISITFSMHVEGKPTEITQKKPKLRLTRSPEGPWTAYFVPLTSFKFPLSDVRWMARKYKEDPSENRQWESRCSNTCSPIVVTVLRLIHTSVLRPPRDDQTLSDKSLCWLLKHFRNIMERREDFSKGVEKKKKKPQLSEALS